jgi:FMN phosphatase YigB (HAD superfamily)
VDGAQVNTNTECLDRVRETWPELYNEEYPLDFQQFSSFRDKVIVIEDYYSLSEEMIKSGAIPLSEMGKIRDDFVKSEKGKKAHKAFYASRENAMKQNLKAWLDSQSLYEGVPEMLQGLNDRDIAMYIVTSKNSEAVQQLLGNHDLLKYIKKIFDKSMGKRPAQFKRVEEETGIKPIETVVYDDLSENLIIARDMGIYPIAAPQGYDKPENLAGFTKAYPRDVPLVMDKLNAQS